MHALQRLKQDWFTRSPNGPESAGWWEHPLLWTALAFLSVVPFILSPLPPVSDLFSHVGRYHVMIFGDQSPYLSEYYRFHWLLVGNLGQDLLAYPLVPLIGAERAGLLLTALIPPVTIYGIRQLSIAVHGRVEQGALLAVPFAYSFPFLYGFVNYCTGIALALIVTAAWIRTRNSSSPIRTVIFALLAALVWLSHMAAWAVLVIAIGSVELAHALKNVRSSPIKAIWAAFLKVVPLVILPIFVMFAFRNGLGEKADSTPLNLYHLKWYWPFFLLRDQSRWFDLASLGALGMGGITLLFLGSRVDRGLAIGAAFLFIFFVILPTDLMGGFFADLRLLPPMVILLCVGLNAAARSRRAASIIAALALALFCVRIGVTTAGWAHRGKMLTDDLTALDHVERGARIAALTPFRMDESWNNSGINHLPSLAIPRREAFVNTEWDVAGSQPMRPIYNDGGDFNSSESAMLRTMESRAGRSVEQALNDLPKGRFDYVWIFKDDIPANARNDFSVVFRNGESVMYRINPVAEK